MDMPESPGRLAVVSPHLDDGVLGCGDLLAAHPGSAVVTVFAGMPAASAPLADWDARCGFADGAQAMRCRREENRRALACLDAQPVLLDFPDEPYRARPISAPTLAAALAGALEALRARWALMPIGLFHRDHLLAAQAGLLLQARDETRPWAAYEDALYRAKPGLLQARLAELRGQGIRATPAGWAPPASAGKARAVAAYASQLVPLGLAPGMGDPALPERYWRLDLPPST